MSSLILWKKQFLVLEILIFMSNYHLLLIFFLILLLKSVLVEFYFPNIYYCNGLLIFFELLIRLKSMIAARRTTSNRRKTDDTNFNSNYPPECKWIEIRKDISVYKNRSVRIELIRKRRRDTRIERNLFQDKVKCRGIVLETVKSWLNLL